MTINATCQCGQRCAVPDDALGKPIRCPACKVVFVIPRPAPQASADPFAGIDLPTQTPLASNPYQSPKAAASSKGMPATPPGQSQQIRNKYFQHERAVKSIGVLYFIGAALAVVVGIAACASADEVGSGLLTLVVCALIAGAHGILGYGFQTLKPWARIPGILLAVPGLIGFPMVTLVSGYVIYLLASEKGRQVFSPQYASVIRTTKNSAPKATTSPIVKVLLYVLLGVVLAICSLFAIGGMIQFFVG